MSPKQFHVCSHCWVSRGTGTEIRHQFTGTRAACRRFIRARGNHGFYFITSISDMEVVRRRYGD